MRTSTEPRTRVAVIFGGRSSEHSISCLSAASVLAALDRERYDVQAIGITRAGSWHQVSDDPADWQRRGDQLPSVPSTGPAAYLPSGTSDLADLPGSIRADVVFPVLHGPYGEDGTIQGALELAAIPYVGSGVLASAATMDKQATKTLLRSAGLPIGKFVAVSEREWARERERILAAIGELRFPVFVKPARAGSSLGISKVYSPAELPAAVAAAQEHDRKLIVEESIEAAREVECGVLASLGHEPARASVCAEITVTGEHDFYDFTAKYIDDTAVLTVPAELPEATHKELGDLAVRAFDALGCDGLARVDFFVGPNGQPVINEVNTMPGFTAISMFPRMWQACGISYPHLIDHLIAVALDRGTDLK